MIRAAIAEVLLALAARLAPAPEPVVQYVYVSPVVTTTPYVLQPPYEWTNRSDITLH